MHVLVFVQVAAIVIVTPQYRYYVKDCIAVGHADGDHYKAPMYPVQRGYPVRRVFPTAYKNRKSIKNYTHIKQSNKNEDA